MTFLAETCVRCQVGFLAHLTKRTFLRVGCGKWSCPLCGPRKVRRFRRRIEARRWQRLVTLTQPADVGEPTREHVRAQARAWARLRHELRRRYGLSDYVWVREQARAWARLRHDLRRLYGLSDYVWVREQAPATRRLHLHLLIRSGYIPQRALSRLAARAGFGAVCDIRRVRGRGGPAYVSKYLAKDAASARWPRYTRRAQTSVRDSRCQASDSGWRFYRMAGPWPDVREYVLDAADAGGTRLHLIENRKTGQREGLENGIRHARSDDFCGGHDAWVGSASAGRPP